MCRDYRMELPCSIPWTLDDDGACSILIEDQINARGPSRRVFTAYVAVIASGCVLATLGRLWHLVRHRRSHAGVGHHAMLRRMHAQGLVAQLYAASMVALQAVDIQGYGGRLSYLSILMLRAEATVGVVATISSLLGSAHIAEAPLPEMAARREQVAFAQRMVLGTVFIAMTCGTLLEHLLRPVDAAVGVTVAALVAIKSVVIFACLTAASAAFLRAYQRLRRRLEAGKKAQRAGRRKPRGRSVLQSRSIKVHSLASSPEKRQSSLSSWGVPASVSAIASGSSASASTSMLEEGRAPRQPSSRSVSHTAFGSSSLASWRRKMPRHRPAHHAPAEAEASLHQVGTFAVLIAVLAAGGAAQAAVFCVKAVRECYVLEIAAPEQWTDGFLLTALVIVAIVTAIPLVTHHLPCYRGGRVRTRASLSQIKTPWMHAKEDAKRGSLPSGLAKAASFSPDVTAAPPLAQKSASFDFPMPEPTKDPPRPHVKRAWQAASPTKPSIAQTTKRAELEVENVAASAAV